MEPGYIFKICFICLALFIVLIHPISADYAGYLTLLTTDEFNKKIQGSDSKDLQWDTKADNTALLQSDTEFYEEEGLIPPVSYYIDLGNYLIGMERYKDAEDAFETALSGDERNIEGIIGLGMVKFYLGSYPYATTKFDEAIKLDARNIRAWTYKAVSQANTKNMNGAIESIEKATSYDPSDALARYYAAVIYAEAGDLEKAGSAIQKAADLKPDNYYIQTFFDEIASDGSLPDQNVQITDVSLNDANSGETITDITESMQSFKDISGFGEIYAAEKVERGTESIIRYSEKGDTSSGIPVEYHVVITADPIEGTTPLTVHFSDESTGTRGVIPVQWTWKSNMKEYSGREYTHTFSLPGTYTVDWKIIWSDGKVSTSTVYTNFKVQVQDSGLENSPELIYKTDSSSGGTATMM